MVAIHALITLPTAALVVKKDGGFSIFSVTHPVLINFIKIISHRFAQPAIIDAKHVEILFRMIA